MGVAVGVDVGVSVRVAVAVSVGAAVAVAVGVAVGVGVSVGARHAGNCGASTELAFTETASSAAVTMTNPAGGSTCMRYVPGVISVNWKRPLSRVTCFEMG